MSHTSGWTTPVGADQRGAFGGFTWGVLDRLLEEEHITFDPVSVASAGVL